MYKMTIVQSLPRPNACFPLLVPMGAGVFFGEIKVHYYTHNIGDYRRDTSHLSLLEHGVYRQILDTYHLTEQPIPSETDLVCRRLSARTDEERQAIQYVLNEFFELTNDGYRHEQSDQNVREYQAKADRARENGKRGGRPSSRESPVNTRPKTKVVIPGNQDETISQANPLTHKPINLLTKEPNNSLTKEPTKPKTNTRLQRPEGVQESVWFDFLAMRSGMRASVTQTAIDGIEREAHKAGWTLERALRECTERSWRGFKAAWVANKPQDMTFEERSDAAISLLSCFEDKPETLEIEND